MVHHIVLWNFVSGLSAEEKKEAGETIRRKLLEVKEKVADVLELQVQINELDSSNREVALISSFASVEALKAYQVHPEHVKAGAYIKSVTCDRCCFDYSEEK